MKLEFRHWLWTLFKSICLYTVIGIEKPLQRNKKLNIKSVVVVALMSLCGGLYLINLIFNAVTPSVEYGYAHPLFQLFSVQTRVVVNLHQKSSFQQIYCHLYPIVF